MTLGRIFFDLIVSGVATAGFALLFRTETRSLLPGALIGGVWGALIGFLFLNPLLGIVAGAGLGAATGEVGDFGISHRFMNELATHLKPGSSALFIPLKKEAVDETLRALGNSDGVVLSTDLKLEDEYQMEKLFEEMTAERAKKTS